MSRKWLTIIAVLTAAAAAAATAAQPTNLTYQGRLKNGGQPASGLHDLRFRLFDAAQGGTQLGSTQCLNNVTVADGLFTVSVDFGKQFASPDQRFLEIQVREDTGKGCGDGAGFVTLNPRQPLTAAPLASHANSAFALDAADGSPGNAVFVDNAGRVGIGTKTPGHSVTVASTGPTIALQDTDENTTQVGYVSYRNADNAEMAWVGYGTPGSPDFSIVNARFAGNIVLYPILGNVIMNSGNVGIGTETPANKLDVRGDIRLGPDGQGVLATGGVENLRIIRGEVLGDGTKVSGSGFSVDRIEAGDYMVTFTSPFSEPPSVSAMARYKSGAGTFTFRTHENSRVEIISADTDGLQHACDFTFMVIGRR